MLQKGDPTSDPNLHSKHDYINLDQINLEIPTSKNYFLDCFKALTGGAKSRKNKHKENLSGSQPMNRKMLRGTNFSPNKSASKSQKSDSVNMGNPKQKYKKKQGLSSSVIEEESKNNNSLINIDEHMGDTMKKTLEENNKEREINLFNDSEPDRFKNQSYKYSSAPVSNKNSDTHESIFSNSMKLAAFRASELKKRNHDLVQKYGSKDILSSTKSQLGFIKKLHNAAITIQTFWREYILTHKSPGGYPKSQFLDFRDPKNSHPNNNRSTSRNACSIPKLDLSAVGSKKELEGLPDGLFHPSPLLDLSTKHIQNLLMTPDLSSMLQVREEALNYKIKQERQKILKFSPRTICTKEMELEKWVELERRDIDRTRQVYEENRRKTEDIIRETVGVEGMLESYEMTQEGLRRFLADRVTTPREGHSFRSGFNSSRRLYELAHVNEQIREDNRGKHIRSQGQEQDFENIVVSNSEESKGKMTLKQKIEMKLKADQEITFEKNREDMFFQADDAFEEDSDDMLGAFKDEKLSKKRSYEKIGNMYSSNDSGLDLESSSKKPSKTPNLFDTADSKIPPSTPKDPSKSLDISAPYKNPKDPESPLSKDSNSNSISLIRIKSEHNLKDQPTSKPITTSKKDKTYNSKNFFTENFDDQEMDDAIKKIKSNPDLSSPTKNNQEDNVELLDDPETISFDENNWKIDLGQTMDRGSQKMVKAILERANQDFKGSQGSSAILVNDQERKDELAEESSTSDIESKDRKHGFLQIKNKFEDGSKKINNLFDSTFEETKEKITSLDNSRHSRSFEDLPSPGGFQDENQPVSKINIERIGSPNKPKFSLGSPDHSSHIKDTRQKIDDSDEDEEEIITGSQTVNNSTAKNIQDLDLGGSSASHSMADYFKQSKLVKDDNLTGDIKIVINDICQKLIKELDEELFPQRPLFLLTADLSSISLEQATTLLKDMTPEKERLLVEKIMERQNEQIKRKKSSKSSQDTGKLVLYENKGIRTDLVAIKNYVEALYTHIQQIKQKEFMKTLFSPIKHDPFEVLNQLQNSDIGSYEHFQVDMNLLAVLQLDTYLEMENYWKKKYADEEKVQELGKDGEPILDNTKEKPKKYDPISDPSTDKNRKSMLRECEHIHNKALFDCVNEALIPFRPYGKDGEPAPWSRKKRKLNKGKKMQKDLKQIFDKVKHDMFKWSIMQAGTLPRKDFIFNKVFDDELFAEIREKKLATLLATEVIENEPQWLNYDFEEAQVRIDLGDMILEQLVSEAIAVMNVVDETEHKKSIFTDPELVEKLIINEPYYYDTNLYDFDDENDYYY